jgi:pimeloyl-ACP methyl ester carboxylesterase
VAVALTVVVAGTVPVGRVAAGASEPTGAGRALATPTAASARTITVRPCPASPTIECGSIRVPLYWEQPTDRATVTVRFDVFPHSDTTSPAAEPIVAMEGGPGYPSIGSRSEYIPMLGPLLEHHDLILMDQRGTGASHDIDCPTLQRYNGLQAPGDIEAAAAACAARLGAGANAYGSDAVGDDLAAILDGLHIPRIDLYGDSYGTYVAQVFTLHHPGMVRALVLDGTYDNDFNPFEVEAVAALRTAWTDLCHRSSCPESSILSAIASYEQHLERHPLVTTALDPAGRSTPVELTAAAFAQLVDDATYSYTDFRDLPGALAAVAAGDTAPLARLALEDVAANAAGPPDQYSVGDLQAVSCHDYPTVWNGRSDDTERARQLSAAIADLPSTVFAPFSKWQWLDGLDENELVYACLDWPRPAIADPPFPRSLHYPDTPVLIFDGEFDQATPVADALQAVHRWPDSTFVEVSNANHVTAQQDTLGCTSVILQRFIANLAAGDTGCAKTTPPVYVVPVFPTSVTDAPSVTSPTSPAGRAAWVGGETIGDALARFFCQVVYTGDAGLYGGSFRISGGVYPPAPATLHLSSLRFVPDLAVSGTVVWTKATSTVAADVTVSGPSGLSGRLHYTWLTNVAGAVASIEGTVGRSPVSATMPAPWSASP